MSRDGVIEVICRHAGPGHDPILRAAAVVQAMAVFQLCAFQRGIAPDVGHPYEAGFAKAMQTALGSAAPLYNEYAYDLCACGEHLSAWVHNKDWKPTEKEEA